jgi:transcriptional antiterminator RfaH
VNDTAGAPTGGYKWQALYTKARHEKQVDAQLEEKKIESYLPLVRTLKKWSDRRKWVSEPLFRGYVFFRGGPEDRYRAVQCAGVVRVVSFRGQVATVRDEEIGWIRRILAETADPEACAIDFAVGDQVEIATGPLAGIRGRLEESRGTGRFVVSIPSIAQGIRFHVEGWNLKRAG